jgi:hypothetical protein
MRRPRSPALPKSQVTPQHVIAVCGKLFGHAHQKCRLTIRSRAVRQHNSRQIRPPFRHMKNALYSILIYFFEIGHFTR